MIGKSVSCNALHRTCKILIGIISLIPISGVLHAQTTLQATQLINQLKKQNATFAFDSKKQLRFLSFKNGTAPTAAKSSPIPTNANHYNNQYGSLFGLSDANSQLAIKNQFSNSVGRSTVKYKQVHRSVDVFGGDLIINTRDNQLTSMNGRIAQNIVLNVDPVVSLTEAQYHSTRFVAKWYATATENLLAKTPKLLIYDPKLFERNPFPPRLAWKVIVVGINTQNPIEEVVLIDAINGNPLLHFSQIENIKNRQTFDLNNDINSINLLPGTLVCDETDDNETCTNGSISEADLAHKYSGDTYDYYWSRHNRDSLDNKGMTLVSSVRYCEPMEPCPYPNAFWSSELQQMVYGQGLAKADDVVAHELTHGFTDHTSQLIYFDQSGAINESLSDMWGEFVDLTNNSGSDNPEDRWKMGEDSDLGVIRDMKNPVAYRSPDRMTHPNYFTGFEDNGGVHFNSSINNKAVSLMTDGGTFNGLTIRELGIEKVSKIYYEAQTTLITSGTTYFDLYYILIQACQNLNDTSNITQEDCHEVQKALDAVELNKEPFSGFNPNTGLCSEDNTQVSIKFFEDFESDNSAWNYVNAIGGENWSVYDGQSRSIYGEPGQPITTSGKKSLIANGNILSTTADLSAEISLNLPDKHLHLHFRHLFELEAGNTAIYDGGVVEYSLNDGQSWNDMSRFFVDGKGYAGTISAGSDNPLAGRNAFSGSSRGFVSTRYEIDFLAGRSVKFRWRMGLDSSAFFGGWIVDDVQIYTCNKTPIVEIGLEQTAKNNENVTLTPVVDDLDGKISTYHWIQIQGTQVVLSDPSIANPSFQAPDNADKLVFELTVTDDEGASAQGTVTVEIIPKESKRLLFGCNIQSSAPFDPTLLLVLAVVIAYVRRTTKLAALNQHFGRDSSKPLRNPGE